MVMRTRVQFVNPRHDADGKLEVVVFDGAARCVTLSSEYLIL